MYDVLIKGGRVIDPSQRLDGKMDIGINGTKVASVAKNIAGSLGKKVLDAGGKIVTPGLIDVHCHVCHATISNGAPVDMAGVRQGVTTVVDAGSAGEALFEAFPKYLVPQARTTVYCFLHICSLGLAFNPELRDMWEINAKATEEKIKAHPGLIKGVKLRLVGPLVAEKGMEILKTAKQVAKNSKLPLMIHIGDMYKLVDPAFTRKALPVLEKGDVLSHIYTAQQGSPLLASGRFIPEYKEARDRGVIFDIAQGRYNFSFNVARRAMASGIMPYTISSDLTLPSMTWLVFGLPVIMSKMLALGLTLKDVITMTTVNPAKVIGIADRKGSLKPGMDADVSILELKTGKWKLEDCEKQVIEGKELITPVLTVKAGKVVLPKIVARPEQMK